MILEKGAVRLESAITGKDWNYVYDLALKYPFRRVKDQDDVRGAFQAYNFLTMIGYVKGKRSGVAFSNQIPDLGYTADFYVDKDVLPEDLSGYTFTAAEMFLAKLFEYVDDVYAVIDGRDRKLNKFAVMLGFEFFKSDNDLIIAKKTKEYSHGIAPETARTTTTTSGNWPVTSGA